ncbi:hypothetical protein CYMTET_10402, partial [Cymbomonas tetramitiformis]
MECKWHTSILLSILLTSVIVVASEWSSYKGCKDPLQLWIVVDYALVIVFRLAQFGFTFFVAVNVDEASSAELEGRVRIWYLCTGVMVTIYTIICIWTVVGSIWFAHSGHCLPETGQAWGFVMWLTLSYAGLCGLAAVPVAKWLSWRTMRLRNQQFGSPRIVGELQLMHEVAMLSFGFPRRQAVANPLEATTTPSVQ